MIQIQIIQVARYLNIEVVNKDPELLAEARRQYYQFFKTVPEDM